MVYIPRSGGPFLVRGAVFRATPIISPCPRAGDPVVNFLVKEIAIEWRLSTDTIQRLFEDEPDVFKLETPPKIGSRKPRATLVIPAAVKDRVWRRRTNKPRVN
jgi:hypothetical protein